MSLIDKLTPQQEALIPIYWEKWRNIALSTERIHREKTTQAIFLAYAAISKLEPEIIFCDSPYASLKIITSKQVETNLCKELINYIFPKLTNNNKELSDQINRQLINQLRILPLDYISLQYISIDERKIQNRLKTTLDSLCFKSESFASTCSRVDFCISVLDCSYSQMRWLILQSIVKYCGWIWPYEKVCIVCDRPLQLRFDHQNRLHAEGEPAIEFTDGYSLYSYHGVTLSEKYGKIHPQQWQANWLLSEKNAELRRVLIQGIGYARICQELQAVELDTWAEYILLKIDADVDSEPIYLLKMTCPSTGLIHVLRVPPDMESAREAIRWVNWGIEPEEFSVQT